MAILKILSRHTPSYQSLITYILNEAKVSKDEIYTNNLRSNDISGYVHEFIDNEAFRKQSRADQIYLFHEILSFAVSDSALIMKPMLDDLIAEYVRLRGETAVSLAAAHRDREHVHVHFCTSALQYRTGKSIGLSKAQLHELKVSFQEYHMQKYPELSNSQPEHGKGERYASHARWRAERREEIRVSVRECFERAKTQEDFLSLLRERGLYHYERNGRITGIEEDSAKFRFSRLLEAGQFEQLPNEQPEVDRVLDEIRAVRERQAERNERNKANEEQFIYKSH